MADYREEVIAETETAVRIFQENPTVAHGRTLAKKVSALLPLLARTNKD